jgi:hypothetical protein
MGDEEGLLSEEEVAALLQQMPVSMVRRLHREGAGPPCVEIGRHARYRHTVVQRWLEETVRAAPRPRTAHRRDPLLQSQIGRCCQLRERGTAQVEAASWLSVVVRSGPFRTAVNGTLWHGQR